VYCPVYWPRLPAGVRRCDFRAAVETGDEMLGLPIDQRYGDAEIDELIRRFLAACRDVS
jgi:hypothetical protein